MGSTKSFRAYVELVRRAEVALVKQLDQTDPQERVQTLRGIYYGTTWSLDFKVEKSQVRNVGFLTYTGGSVPADPREALGTELFEELQNSQSLSSGGLNIDVGHVLIGWDTRSSLLARNMSMPRQGGTGLEIVTWLGDLGGGTANLAYRRVSAPQTSVQSIFHNKSSDYGVSDNLEGDVGGYLIAAAGATPGGAPDFPRGKGVADMLEAYLPVGDDRQWRNRAIFFAGALGAQITREGIVNAAPLVERLSNKLYDFAVWYMATRYVKDGKLRKQDVLTACQHVKPAASEVAIVFVRTLARALVNPSAPIVAAGPYPAPSKPGPCESQLLSACAVDPGSFRKTLEKSIMDLFK